MHALPEFRSGSRSPRALLEHCLEAVAAHEASDRDRLGVGVAVGVPVGVVEGGTPSRSRTKISKVAFVSAGTRFEAKESNTTKRPSLTVADWLKAFP